MTTTQGPMARAVAAALRDAKPEKQDVGGVALAKRYAALIDEAVPLAKYDVPLRALRLAVTESSDPKAVDHLAKVEQALAAHSVASDLGPKLLAALTALGMTAAGRGVKGGVPSGNPVAAAVDEFTKRRTRRQQSTG